MKIFRLINNKELRIVLTLVLFVLIFAAAGTIKIKAAGNVTGWLWGGSEDCDMDRNGFRDVLCGGDNTNTPVGTTGDGLINGNETGLGWISVNGDNSGAEGGADYGVTIPTEDGPLSGCAWSENIGYLCFDPLYLAGCPSEESCQARREGNFLKGWARFMEIRSERMRGNSGGWEGWVSLNSSNCDSDENKYIDVVCGGDNSSTPVVSYGVDLTKLDGTGQNHTYAWSDELGWIDFSRVTVAEFPATIEFVPSSETMNESSTNSVTLRETKAYDCGQVNLASSNESIARVTSSTQLDFSASAQDSENVTLQAESVEKDESVQITAVSERCGNATLELNVSDISVSSNSCECGTANGQNFCGINALTAENNDLCPVGLSASDFQATYSQYKWTCDDGIGGCDPKADCSASAICGWIETNP